MRGHMPHDISRKRWIHQAETAPNIAAARRNATSPVAIASIARPNAVGATNAGTSTRTMADVIQATSETEAADENCDGHDGQEQAARRDVARPRRAPRSSSGRHSQTTRGPSPRTGRGRGVPPEEERLARVPECGVCRAWPGAPRDRQAASPCDGAHQQQIENDQLDAERDPAVAIDPEADGRSHGDRGDQPGPQ